MKTLYGMVLRSFLAIFTISALFFILVLQLLDLFTNLWRYLAHDTQPLEILKIALLYLPKCLSYSLSPALLFSVAFTLGSLYKNNELIAILGSGVSLRRLVAPFLLIGLLFSLAGFFFEDSFVIDSTARKNALYRAVVRQEISFSNTNVTVISEDAGTIYQVDYYNDQKQTVNGVLILRRNEAGGFGSRIDADWGEWNGRYWRLHNSRSYTWNERLGAVELEKAALLEARLFVEPPSTFRKTVRNVEEMRSAEARQWVQKLKKAGLPYRGALTEYYEKFIFALTPLVVVLLATGVGGRFKRNVLLMNLLAALVMSVVYYVVQMVSVILAKNALIPPLAGAGLAFALFSAVGILALRTART